VILFASLTKSVTQTKNLPCNMRKSLDDRTVRIAEASSETESIDGTSSVVYNELIELRQNCMCMFSWVRYRTL
jgi:hypothetical protein